MLSFLYAVVRDADVVEIGAEFQSRISNRGSKWRGGIPARLVRDFFGVGKSKGRTSSPTLKA